MQSRQRFLGFGHQRVAAVGGDVLVMLGRPRVVTHLLVGLPNLVNGVGTTLAALAILLQTTNGLLRLAQVVQIHITEQSAGMVPCLLILVRGENLRLLAISLLKNCRGLLD